MTSNHNAHFVGWDIGGAHLKMACVDPKGEITHIEQVATPLWRGLEQLERVFPVTVNKLPEGARSHVVTMTAELVDIFKDRNAGVSALINLCKKNLGQDLRLYASHNGILELDSLQSELDQLASTNWHASAVFIASRIASGIFVDVGSTTTDIIPFSQNKVLCRGEDDRGRLCNDELVYTGVIRTPLMALSNRLPFRGEWQNLAAENFSTTADVYRILGLLEEDDDLMDTPDGQDKSLNNSIRRLARMAGTDADKAHLSDWWQLAQYFEEIQLQQLSQALLRVMSKYASHDQQLIGAGVGRFLVRKLAQRLNLNYIEFSELCESEAELKHHCNVCAPAVALAQLNRLALNS